MEERIITMPDGQSVDATGASPETLERLRVAGLKMLEQQTAAEMSRNPYEGGGPMPKIPFSDPRINAVPETLRVGAKTAYDATLGIPVGIGQMVQAGLEGSVGLVSPEQQNKMRESREFAAQADPLQVAARKAEQFIQPRSAEGTRLANIGSMIVGGGLMGKAGTAFSPAMGAASGAVAGLGSEGYGVASNPKKWQGDPANDEQAGKLLMGLAGGIATPYLTRGGQAMFSSGRDKIRHAVMARRSGMTPEDIELPMRPDGILPQSERVGIPLTTAQAIPKVNYLDAAQSKALDRLEMVLTRRKLEQQPGQSLAAMKDWEGQSVLRGGEVRSPQTLANSARASANAHFDSISAEAGAAKDLAMLQAGGSGRVGQDTATQFLDEAKAYAAANPGTRANRVVSSVERAITDPKWLEHEKTMKGVQPELPNPMFAQYANDPKMQAVLQKAGHSPTIPNPKYVPNPYQQFLSDQNQVRKALDSSLAQFGKNMADTKQVNAELNKHAGYLRGLIEDIIAPETPTVNAGKAAAERVLRRADVDKQQLVGGMRGAEDVPAPLSGSPSEVFKDPARAPAVGQVGEISKMRRDLEGGTAFGLNTAAATGKPGNPNLNRNLFPDSARTFFNDVLNEAGASGGARQSDSIANILAEKLGNFSRASDKTANKTLEVLKNAGESQGPLMAGQVQADAQKLRDIMDVVGHTIERRGAGGTSTAQVSKNMGPEELKTISGFSFVSPMRFPFRAGYRMHETASAKWLDFVLNSDEGRAEFARLMRMPEESMNRAVMSNILREMSTQPRKLDEAKAAQQMNRRVSE